MAGDPFEDMATRNDGVSYQAIRDEWERRRAHHAAEAERLGNLLAELDAAFFMVTANPPAKERPAAIAPTPAAKSAPPAEAPASADVRRRRHRTLGLDDFRAIVAGLGITFSTNEAVEAYGRSMPNASQCSRVTATRRLLADLVAEGALQVERVGAPRQPAIWRRGKTMAKAAKAVPASARASEPGAVSPSLAAKKRRLLAMRNGSGKAPKVDGRLKDDCGPDFSGLDDDDAREREDREADRFAGAGIGDGD